MKLKSSKNINDYKSIIKGLYNDFGDNFVNTIMIWCGFIDDDPLYDNCLWEIWIVYHNNKPIGICGLYSLEDDVENLWLGWMGVLPEFRGEQHGKKIVSKMIDYAKVYGAKKLWCYIDKSENVLGFYEKLGFKRKCKVRNFLKYDKSDLRSAFENLDDVVISKSL